MMGEERGGGSGLCQPKLGGREERREAKAFWGGFPHGRGREGITFGKEKRGSEKWDFSFGSGEEKEKLFSYVLLDSSVGNELSQQSGIEGSILILRSGESE